jgi:putative hydrolase of the HAD superfamily
MCSLPAAITFDVGGTLIEPWPSVGAVYAGVAAEHGLPGLAADELTRRFHRAWRARANFDYTRHAWAELVDATFAGLTAEPPSRTCFDALYRRFEAADCWRVFEDVLPALKELRARGLRLGVISNWDDRLRPLLERLHLARWFEVIVISCEVGSTKPSPAIFHAAARQFGLSPADFLHVGDSAEADVAGARRAGWAALRVVRHGPDGRGTISGLASLTAAMG